MNRRDEQAAKAREKVDSNRYMTLATADESGVPWASQVWYATEDYREDVRPPARHRLYRATASEDFMLSSGDECIPVSM